MSVIQDLSVELSDECMTFQRALAISTCVLTVDVSEHLGSVTVITTVVIGPMNRTAVSNI